MKKILVMVMIIGVVGLIFAQKQNSCTKSKGRKGAGKVGEVSVVNTKENSITFIDFNKDSIAIVVSPKTQIIDITNIAALDKKIKGSPNKEKQRKIRQERKAMPKNIISLEEIHVGDCIFVVYENNETSNRDVLEIKVIKKQVPSE
ncbi:MAG: hypothetical protein ACRC4W_07770 [Treponemataceae bacterium]